MKISEVIEKLQELQKEYGDIAVTIPRKVPGYAGKYADYTIHDVAIRRSGKIVTIQ